MPPRQRDAAAPMIARGFSMVVLALAAVCAGAEAQTSDGSEESILEKAGVAFFHVETRGTPRDPADPTQEAVRTGKAFAVGPDTLVTARNVVGTDDEWKRGRTTRDEITRTVRPLDRTVTLGAVTGPDIAADSLLVLPAPSTAIDAASIVVPGLQLGAHFRLSLCDLVEGRIYNALMTSASDPSLDASLRDLAIVPLVARGHEPATYGSLYVFEPAEQAAFASEPWGHGGSPILDEDGDVAAVIAAVTVGPGGISKVLATPIQPLFPGTGQILARGPDPATPDDRLKCSMVDMVGRIHEQVASHAIWVVRAETDDDGEPTGEIVFEYESVADPPNIASIEVRYEFWGTEIDGDPELTRIAFRRSDEDVIRLDRPRGSRSFSTPHIVNVGRDLVEPYIRPNNGTIQYVRLTITPKLTTGEVLVNRRKVYRVQWSTFQ